MENVLMTHMKDMKIYGTTGLFNLRTIVILTNFETQSQKKFCELNQFQIRIKCELNRFRIN